MKAISIIFSLLILCISCSENENKDKDVIDYFQEWSGADTSYIEYERKYYNIPKQICDFYYSKNYIISFNKSDIPVEVIKSLSDIEGMEFRIGDLSDSGMIELGDLIISDVDRDSLYKNSLNFVLFNDSTCLISYRSGRRIIMDILDYFQYKGNITHIRYRPSDYLDDTVALRKYFVKHKSLFDD